MAAVNKGHLHIAEILVKNGADVNYRSKVRALIPVTQVYIMWPMITQAKRTTEAIRYLVLYSGFGGSLRLLLNHALAAR
jgi:hypothetical protein